ncbi:MAG TPA: hypothetical protein VF332_00250 [Vicinamibacterales bacterium]
MRSFARLMTIVLASAWLSMAQPAFAQQSGGSQGGTGALGAAAAQALRAEVDRLRQEFEAVKQQYGDRLAALEARLKTMDAAPAATVDVPSGAGGAGGPEGALPVYGNASILSKVFNPDMAVIGDFLGAAGANRVAQTPALEMHESELSFQAVVDPYARADFFLTIGPDGGIDVEEGFLTFTGLPGGLLVKVGKLHSAFGKVNQMHNHILPWADRPLMTENLVGGEEGISDAGISVSRLIPNRWMFLEATGEVYRGQSAIFRAPSRGDLTYVGHVRGYQDLGESTNVDLGASVAYGHNGVTPDATTRLIGVDATFRYRPLRRAIYRRFLARTELVWSRRSELAAQPQSFGAYVSGEYQLGRRWFAGARFDYADRASNPSLSDKGESLILTYWPSEFSQIRGQLRRTRYAEGTTANEFLFQFLFSIGAHGAHTF